MRPPLRRAFLVLGLAVFLMLVLFLGGLVLAGMRNDAAREAQVSAGGLRVEQAFPRDTWFFLDFSTLGKGQRDHFEFLLAQLTQDPVAFWETFLEGIDGNLRSIDLSYVNDIAPMVGKNGFRFALGMSDGGAAPIAHAAMTVEDPVKAADFLSRLERQGRFLKKIAEPGQAGGGQAIYFNAAAFNEGAKEIYYFTLFGDLLLAANDEAGVLEMVGLLKSVAMATAGRGGESLWTQAAYQEVLEELPAEHLVSLYVNNGLLTTLRERQAAGIKPVSGAGVSASLTQYLTAQGLTFKATASGLDFRGIALGDREALDAAETTLDELRAYKTYLHKFMPSERLAVYLESYGFANMVERQLGVSSANLSALKGFGLDEISSSSLESLFGKGYAVALHQNNGFLPGITLMVDVTDGRGSAAVLKEALDKKVSDLVALLKFQGGALGESVSRESVMIGGGEFTALRLNVKAFMEVYGQAGPFTLPDAVEGEDVWLFYGITKAGQFMVSTYDSWLDGLANGAESVPLVKDSVYRETLDALGEFEEGVVYVRFGPLLALLDTFQAFRGALARDAQIVYDAEAAPVAKIESGEGVEPEGVAVPAPVGFQDVRAVSTPVNWAELLAPLQSFAFSSEAEQYTVRLGGAVRLKNP